MSFEWFTIRQIAQHLKVSREVVYKLCQRKKMPGYKVGGQWRFDVKEIDDWVRTRRPWAKKMGKKTSVKEER